MPIQTTTTITCDHCNEPIVYNGTQTTGYVSLTNQIIFDANNDPQIQLPELVPPFTAFCGLDCVKQYTPPPPPQIPPRPTQGA